MKKILSTIVIILASTILLTTVKAGNYRTINVDGDVSDWTGINPVTIARALESLDIRNSENLIWISFPSDTYNEWIIYDLELQAVIASMQVTRYKGIPISYTDSFNANSNLNYKLIIENMNLTSIDIEINGVKVVQLGNGNINYEEHIPSQYLNIGTNQITATSKGQPDTYAVVKIVDG
jgi:hypothetical protein